jgi:hypothetical protein
MAKGEDISPFVSAARRKQSKSAGNTQGKNKQYVRALRRLCCVSELLAWTSRSKLWTVVPCARVSCYTAPAPSCSGTETATAQRPLHKGYRARSMDSSRPSFLAPSCSASVPLHSHDKNPGIQTHQWCHLSSSIYRLERSLEPLKIYLSIYLLYIKSVLQANQKLEN